jgi:hypothetical protein
MHVERLDGGELLSTEEVHQPLMTDGSIAYGEVFEVGERVRGRDGLHPNTRDVIAREG